MAEKSFVTATIQAVAGGFRRLLGDREDDRPEEPVVSLYNQGPLCIEFAIGPDVVSAHIVCSICLERHYLDEKAVMLICGHYYHISCYEEWKQTCIRNKRIVSCPNCRG